MLLLCYNNRMNLTKKVAWNSGVQFAGRVAAVAVSFVSVKLLTTKLGPAGYGQYAAILNYVTFFGVMADFGFFWILVRELSFVKSRKETNYVTANILTFRSFFAMLVLAIAVIGVYLVPTGLVQMLTPQLKLGILVVAIATFWQSLNSTFVGVFQANYQMDRPVIADIIGRIVSLGLLVPFLFYHLNVVWLVSAMVWGAMANFAINMGFSKKYADLSLGFDTRFWGKVWHESSALGIVSVLALVYFKIDGIMLAAMKNATDVGIYSAPYKIIEIINVFPAIFMGMVFTALTQTWQTDRERANHLINRSIEAMTLIALPVLVGGVILAKPIMILISSASYANYSTVTVWLQGHAFRFDGILVLQLLLVAVAIDAYANIFGKGIIAFGSTKLLLWPNIAAVIVNVGLNLFVIPRWSYAGATIVTIITEGLVLLLQILIIRRFIRLRIPWGMLGRAILAVLTMAVVLWPLRNHFALIGVMVGTAVYLGAAWLFKAISPESVRLLRERS